MQDQYRWCPRCRTQYPQAEWSATTDQCRECRNLKNVAYRSTARGAAKSIESGRRKYEEGRAFLAELKSKPCVDCGQTFPPRAMHFDHRDPSTKTKNLNELATASRARILAEAAKCDLRCALCHALRTDEQLAAGAPWKKGGRPRKHGVAPQLPPPPVIDQDRPVQHPLFYDS